MQEVETYGKQPNWFIKYFSIRQLEYYAKLDG